MNGATKSAVLLCAAALAVCAAPLFGQDGKPGDKPAERKGPPTIYAVRFNTGPKWVAGKSPFEQPGIREHIANMNAWAEKKVMWFGGPFLDGTGGLCGIRAKDLEEAKKLADDDPCVKSGLFVPEVHPWMLACAPKDE
jgi:uncharacterized protein YciI